MCGLAGRRGRGQWSGWACLECPEERIERGRLGAKASKTEPFGLHCDFTQDANRLAFNAHPRNTPYARAASYASQLIALLTSFAFFSGNDFSTAASHACRFTSNSICWDVWPRSGEREPRFP